MDSSLPILPGTTIAPEALQGIGGNIVINHTETGSGDEFGALLDNQYAALSESPASVSPVVVDVHELLPELQDLPPGGKLLPFLQEALGLAATPELDGQQLLEQLSAKLETLEPANAEAVVQSLSGLIQQLNVQTSITPREISGDAVAPQGQLAEFIHQQLRSPNQAQPRIAEPQLSHTADTAALKPSISGQPVLESSQTGLDKAMQQLQMQPQAPEGRQSDLALLMSAFRRQQADGTQRAGADRHAGPELLSVAGSAMASVTTGNTISSSVLPTTSVQTPFGQANWDQSVGERIQWMVGQKMQGAQVKLNPANLGPMEVRIQVQNDQASVQFTAHNAMVREALEAALPRLREMFEASGVELVDVDVSGHSFAEQQATGEDAGENAWSKGVADADTPELILESGVASLAQTGRLDLFA